MLMNSYEAAAKTILCYKDPDPQGGTNACLASHSFS